MDLVNHLPDRLLFAVPKSMLVSIAFAGIDFPSLQFSPPKSLRFRRFYRLHLQSIATNRQRAVYMKSAAVCLRAQTFSSAVPTGWTLRSPQT